MLEEGKKAPAFSLLSDDGKKISLKDYIGQKIVLYFYPKDNTPGCTTESCDFRDSFARLKNFNAAVLGVSKDSVASHQKFKAKFEFPFPLLSDEDTSIIQKYGAWKEKKNYGKTYMGIERTTVIIDEKGKVAKIFPKVKVKGHVDEVIEFLKGLD